MLYSLRLVTCRYAMTKCTIMVRPAVVDCNIFGAKLRAGLQSFGAQVQSLLVQCIAYDGSFEIFRSMPYHQGAPTQHVANASRSVPDLQHFAGLGRGRHPWSPSVPTFRTPRVGHFKFCLPVAFVASPDLHGRFKCGPASHSIGAFLVISTCLAMFCTSATFTATAFPSPSPPCHFCAHLTFKHSLSFPISHFPPRFPHAFLPALCPFWHICCLGTGFERLPLVRLPCWRYRWKCLILVFLKSP
jgi:hypothetical protein